MNGSYGLAIVRSGDKRMPSFEYDDSDYDDDDYDYEYVSRCPACGSPIDYCLGHGPSGDPDGYRILQQHDDGNHVDCDPEGCDDAPRENR